MVLTQAVLKYAPHFSTSDQTKQFRGHAAGGVAPPAGKHHTPRNTDTFSLDAIGNYGTTAADASKLAGACMGQLDPVYFFNLEDGEGISDVCAAHSVHDSSLLLS